MNALKLDGQLSFASPPLPADERQYRHSRKRIILRQFMMQRIALSVTHAYLFADHRDTTTNDGYSSNVSVSVVMAACGKGQM